MIFQLCWANCVRMYKLQINYLNRLNFAHFGKQRGEFNTVLWKISLSLSSLHNIFFPWLRCNSDVGLFLAREIKRKGFIDSILSKFNAVMLLCKLVQGGCICKLAGEKEAATIFFSWGGGWGWGLLFYGWIWNIICCLWREYRLLARLVGYDVCHVTQNGNYKNTCTPHQWGFCLYILPAFSSIEDILHSTVVSFCEIN